VGGQKPREKRARSTPPGEVPSLARTPKKKNDICCPKDIGKERIPKTGTITGVEVELEVMRKPD